MADNDQDDKDKVGHGKPPKASRFKEGQSGNPKGRPRGSQNVSTLFQRIGRQRVKVTESGRTRSMTKLEAIILQAHNKAMAGKDRGFNDYLSAYKAFVPSEQSGGASELPAARKAVMADLIRRIRETGEAERRGEAEPHENSNEETEENER